MTLTFFGTGSSTPTPKQKDRPFRSHAGFSIETGEDFLLFDIGPGTVTKMLQAGIDVLKYPTHLFISHFHLDHCLDYITLAKARALAKGLENADVGKLFVFGPEGLHDFSKSLFEGIKQWDYMSKQLKVYEVLEQKETMDGIAKETNSWKVTAKPIMHYSGVCYRLQTEGTTIVYSGDMGYDETISKLGRGADIAILECSYPTRETLKGQHLCPEDIGKLAKLGAFKHVYLTHLYPSCEGREDDIRADVKKLADCDVTIAYDGLRVEI